MRLRIVVKDHFSAGVLRAMSKKERAAFTKCVLTDTLADPEFCAMKCVTAYVTSCDRKNDYFVFTIYVSNGELLKNLERVTIARPMIVAAILWYHLKRTDEPAHQKLQPLELAPVGFVKTTHPTPATGGLSNGLDDKGLQDYRQPLDSAWTFSLG